MQTPAKTDAQRQKGQEDNGGFLSRKRGMVEEDHIIHGFPPMKKNYGKVSYQFPKAKKLPREKN